jgi:AraC-like DNA-binding protein
MTITILSIFSEFTLLFFSSKLFLKKSPALQANKFLSTAFIYMLFSNLSMHLLHHGSSAEAYTLLSFYIPMHAVFSMLIAPTIYLYIGMLLFHQPFSWKKTLIHYVPPLIPAVLYLAYFAAQPELIRIQILLGQHAPTQWMVVVLNLLFYLQASGYLIICFCRVYALRQTGYTIAHCGTSINVRHLCLFFLIVISGLAVYILLCGLHRFNHNRLHFSLYLYSTLAIVLFLRAVWHSDFVVQHLTQQSQTISVKPLIIRPEDQLLLDRLNTEMETAQPYLSDHCCIQQVADTINIGRNQLSALLNDSDHNGFNDYINEYRIKHACKLLLEDQALKPLLEVIGTQCGFGSKSSFNRAFKKHTGQTPKEYQQSNGG